MKILIIDDDKTMPMLLSRLLELEGIQGTISSSHSVQDLILEIEMGSYDLILMDVFLKAFNGISALKELRSNHEFKSLPVLMTSGMDLKKDCMNAGATDFLLKPFMPVEMIEKIESSGKKQ